MSNYELSILIPARREMFLKNTVEDILKNKRGNTEIIVGMDEEWSDPPLEDHPDVTILHTSKALGQREMTNQLCRISKAHYVAKTDAHTAFDEGFDVKLLEGFKKTGDNVVVVPVMKNLWVFDWKCPKCKNRTYQGPTPEKCEKCGNTEGFYKKIVWIAKDNPQSKSYNFNNEPHFNYFKNYTKRPEYLEQLKTGFTETMNIQGSFFMCSRDKYWELEICDDKAGSWGNQAIEVACSFWLSGGKVLVNTNTWYSHLFRTAGKDFGFPYKNPGSEVQKTKQYIKDKFWNFKHPKQIYPVSWLVERFWPVDGWTEKDIEDLKEHEKTFISYDKNIV